MIITFCGHAQISDASAVKARLRELLQKLCGGGAIDFYLGGYGDFDGIACSVCAELRRDNSQIRLFFIAPYLNDVREKPYDGTIYPEIERIPLKFAISARNKWMADRADFVIAYVEHAFGGAYQTLCHARRKRKKIYNLAPLSVSLARSMSNSS